MLKFTDGFEKWRFDHNIHNTDNATELANHMKTMYIARYFSVPQQYNVQAMYSRLVSYYNLNLPKNIYTVVNGGRKRRFVGTYRRSKVRLQQTRRSIRQTRRSLRHRRSIQQTRRRRHC